jgi:hypothetical protein
MLIAGLQHFQRFADQFFILVDDPQKALYGFGVSPFAINTRPIMIDTRGYRGRRRLFSAGHRLVHIVIPHLL